MSTRLAWASWAVSVLLALATVVLLLLAGDDTEGETAAFDCVLAVGLLIYPDRRPADRHRGGRRTRSAGCSARSASRSRSRRFVYAYATYALVTSQGRSRAGDRRVAENWVQLPALFGAPALLFLLFPDGRLLGRAGARCCG